METSLTQGILLEVKFELNEPDVIFNPPLEKSIVGNVHDKVIGYCSDIYHICELIPRIASHQISPDEQNNYLHVINENKELKGMKERDAKLYSIWKETTGLETTEWESLKKKVQVG